MNNLMQVKKLDNISMIFSEIVKINKSLKINGSCVAFILGLKPKNKLKKSRK